MSTESAQTAAAHPLLCLTEQDPDTTRICEDEIEFIRAEISPARAYIDHVGSTAIPGMLGKPAIDLLMSPVKWEEAETAVGLLSKIGYVIDESDERAPRFFLKKSITQGSVLEIHLHVAPRDSEWGNAMLVFRDELTADTRLVAKYSALKSKLVAVNRSDLSAYTDGKGDFVKSVVRRAAGTFSTDRLLTHQRAELDRSQKYQTYVLLAQFSVAVVAAISVYVDGNTALLFLAAAGFSLAFAWFVLARKQRTHKTAGDQARRVVLMASGLGSTFSAEQRLQILDKLETSIEGKPLVREESYFASRENPGIRRLADLIQESSYWTRDLQKTSAAALQVGLVISSLLMFYVILAGISTMSQDSAVSLVRTLIAILVFIVSSDVVGGLFAYHEAANAIDKILHRVEVAAAQGYPSDDVYLLLSDYNATVESAPIALPFIYRLRRKALTRQWRSYLETKRAATPTAPSDSANH